MPGSEVTRPGRVDTCDGCGAPMWQTRTAWALESVFGRIGLCGDCLTPARLGNEDQPWAQPEQADDGVGEVRVW